MPALNVTDPQKALLDTFTTLLEQALSSGVTWTGGQYQPPLDGYNSSAVTSDLKPKIRSPFLSTVAAVLVTGIGGGGGGSGTVTSVGSGAGLTGGPITTAGSLALDLAYNPTWTALHTWNFPSIHNDPTADAIHLSNVVAASAIHTKEYSPAIAFFSSVWDSAASQLIGWSIQNQGVPGASTYNNQLVFTPSHNAGLLNTGKFIIDAAGVIYIDGVQLDLSGASAGQVLAYDGSTGFRAVTDTDYYQLIQGNGSSVTQRNTLNVLPRLTVADSGSKTTLDLTTTGVSAGTYTSVTVDVYGRVTAGTSGGGGGSFYQTVELDGAAQTQESTLNFSSDFTASDNAGNGSTDIGIGSGIVRATRQISTSTSNGGLLGGGDLTANRSLVIDVAFSPTWTGNHTFSNPVVGVAPTSANDFVIRSYVDSISSGSSWKASVRTYVSSNITLSGLQVVDGVTLLDSDRVLVANQSTASQNGIYLAHSGSWTLASDWATGSAQTDNVYLVSEGSTYAGTAWFVSTIGAITVGSTSIAFDQLAGLGQVTTGSGVAKSFNTLSIDQAFSPTWTGSHVFTQDVTVKGDNATSGATLKNSSVITLESHYWSSGNNANQASISLTQTATTPTSYLNFTVGGDEFRLWSDFAMEFPNGASAAVSSANRGKIRYNNSNGTFEVSTSGGSWTGLATGTTGTYYQTVQNNGSAVAQQPILDFAARITATNDGAGTRTVIDLASGIVTPGTYNTLTVDTYGRVTAGSTTSYLTTAFYQTIQTAGTPVSQRDVIDFLSDFTVADDSGNDRTKISLTHNSVTVTAGTGLSGGGSVALGSSVSLSLPSVGPGATTTGGGGNIIESVTTDVEGRIVSITTVASGGGSGTVTSVATGNGLQGGAITTSGTIDLRLNTSGGLSKVLGVGTNELGIAANGVTNAMLANSAVTVTAGTGLSGGGSVSLGSSVSLSLPNIGPGVGPQTFATGDAITLDNQGRITAVTKVTRNVTAGTGLSGGGDLSADVTISMPNVGPGTGPQTFATGDAVTLDNQGRITAVTKVTRNIIAGAGLSGGGDLSADRTISMPNVGPGTGPQTFATSDAITLDNQGRITGVTKVTRNVNTSTGLAGGGSIATDLTLTIDQAFSPTWTGAHIFNGNFTIGGTVQTMFPTIIGSNISSAATIAPTTQVAYISGTSTISTITAPSGLTGSTAGGWFIAVPTAAWSWDTGGNINVAGKASTGIPIVFVYRQSAGKWYPSSTGTATGTVGTTGQKIPAVIPIAFRASCGSTAPLVVSRFYFNPSDYTLAGMSSQSYTFRAVIATGSTTVTGHAKLRDLTAGVDICIFNITNQTTEAKSEQTLTVSSAGTNTISSTEARYELSIYVDSPVTSNDTIELYSADMRVISTI